MDSGVICDEMINTLKCLDRNRECIGRYLLIPTMAGILHDEW